MNTCRNLRPGTVGKAAPGVEVEIAPDGEIVTRSPSVMKGYYNKPDDTAEALRDGWFHTGDLGELDADGFLKITDRKKDLIVTAGGKKVAPQPIESRLQTDPLVDQVALVGDDRNYVVALVVPHFENLRAWARRKGIAFTNDADLTRQAAVRERFERSFERVNAQLARFERIKGFAILPREFSQATGELTPTLKLKRGVIQSKHAEVIEQLYSKR